MIIREFKKEDINNGFIETLSENWPITKITEESLNRVLNNENYIFVVEEDDKIVGSIILHLQYKFIHDGGIVGYLDELIVRKKYGNAGMGSKLLKHAIEKAEELGCYKILGYCYDAPVSISKRAGLEVFNQYLMGKAFKETKKVE